MLFSVTERWNYITFLDQKYLVAENGKVNYSVIPESICEKMTSGKFVNVKFKPGNKFETLW